MSTADTATRMTTAGFTGHPAETHPGEGQDYSFDSVLLARPVPFGSRPTENS